jgi:hypothetical protein
MATTRILQLTPTKIVCIRDTPNRYWIGWRLGRWHIHCRDCMTFEEGGLSLTEAYSIARVHNDWWHRGNPYKFHNALRMAGGLTNRGGYFNECI